MLTKELEIKKYLTYCMPQLPSGAKTESFMCFPLRLARFRHNQMDFCADS